MTSQDALESDWLATLAKQVSGKKPEDGSHAEIISLKKKKKDNNSRVHIKSNFAQDSKQEMSMGGEVGVCVLHNRTIQVDE